MRDPKIEDKLEAAINALHLGAEPANVLQLFPQDQAELEPLIKTIHAARRLQSPEGDSLAMQRSRTRTLVESNRFLDRKSTSFLGMRIPRLALAVVMVLLILVFGAGGLIVTSAESLPGDQIYPLKLVVENLRMQFNPAQDSRSFSKSQYNQRRINEVQHLLDMKREEPVVFSGIVEETTQEFWIVADILVKVTDETNFSGEVGRGTLVEVFGATTSDGWVAAQEIKLRTKDLVGVLEELTPEYLSVSGLRIHIDSQTQIDPRLNIGDQVIVLFEALQDDQLWANAILRLPQEMP